MSVASRTDESVVVSGEVGLGPLHVGDTFTAAVHADDETSAYLRVCAIRVGDAAAVSAAQGATVTLDLAGRIWTIRTGDILIGETGA